MKLFRRRSAPLAPDAGASLNLPPVRMGLLTKLNLLTIGLIVLTASRPRLLRLGSSGATKTSDLRQRGAAALRDARRAVGVRALHQQSRATSRRSSRASPPKATSPTRSSSTQGRRGGRRAGSPTRSGRRRLPPLPAEAALPALGTTTATELTIRGRRYVELIAPVGGTKIVTAMGLTQGRRSRRRRTPRSRLRRRSATSAIGYVRLGMTFERQQQQFRKQLRRRAVGHRAADRG